MSLLTLYETGYLATTKLLMNCWAENFVLPLSDLNSRRPRYPWA